MKIKFDSTFLTVLCFLSSFPEFYSVNVNLALKRYSIQSSNYSANGVHYYPSKANDGVFGARLGSWKSCSITIHEEKPWFLISLEKLRIVQQIRILNRENYSTRLQKFYMKTSLKVIHEITNYNDVAFKTIAYQHEPLLSAETKTYTVSTIHLARTFILYATHKVYLTLCEVEMWSMKAISKDKVLSQSSTQGNSLSYHGKQVYDGQVNADINVNLYECFRSNTEQFPWWKVDLGKKHIIFAFTIIGPINNLDRNYKLNFIVSDSNDDPGVSDVANCGGHNGDLQPYTTFRCPKWTVGQYFSIIETNPQTTIQLNLCEVDIFGYELEQKLEIFTSIINQNQYTVNATTKFMDCNGLTKEVFEVEEFNKKTIDIEIKGVGLANECSGKLSSILFTLLGEENNLIECNLANFDDGYLTSEDLFDTCYFRCQSLTEKYIKSIFFFTQKNFDKTYSKEIFFLVKI